MVCPYSAYTNIDSNSNQLQSIMKTQRTLNRLPVKLFLMTGFILLLNSFAAHAQNPGWHQVGNDLDGTHIKNIITNSNLLAYYGTNLNNGSVRRYNNVNNSWPQLGNSFADENVTVSRLKLRIDQNDTPYVVYRVQGAPTTIEVRRFSSVDNIWYRLGDEGTFPSIADHPIDMAIDSNNNVHFTYYDSSENGFKVFRWTDGTGWQQMGATIQANPQNIDLKSWGDHIYLATELDNEYRIHLLNLNQPQDGWVLFGNIISNMPFFDDPAFRISPTGDFYVLRRNNSNAPHRITIYQWQENQWQELTLFETFYQITPENDAPATLLSHRQYPFEIDENGDIHLLFRNDVESDFVNLKHRTQYIKWVAAVGEWQSHQILSHENVFISQDFHDQLSLDTFGNPWATALGDNPAFKTQIFRFGCENLHGDTAPAMSYPANNELDVPADLVLLEWEDAFDCQGNRFAQYEVQWSSDPNFMFGVQSSVIINNDDSSISHQIGNLNPNTTYHWRVRVNGSLNWSDSRSFTTILCNEPPQLFGPEDGSGPLNSSGTALIWNSTSSCSGLPQEQFSIQVATDQLFNNMINELSGNDFYQTDSNSRHLIYQDGLISNTTYYWRVGVVIGAEVTWSDTWTFHTGEINHDLEWEMVQGPNIPGLDFRAVFPVSENHFYLGSSDGRIFYTTNGGINYFEAIIDIPSGSINKITFSFIDDALVVAADNGIYQANVNPDNTFSHFVQVMQSNEPVNEIKAFYLDGGNLYAVTDSRNFLFRDAFNDAAPDDWTIRTINAAPGSSKIKSIALNRFAIGGGDPMINRFFVVGNNTVAGTTYLYSDDGAHSWTYIPSNGWPIHPYSITNSWVPVDFYGMDSSKGLDPTIRGRVMVSGNRDALYISQNQMPGAYDWDKINFTGSLDDPTSVLRRIVLYNLGGQNDIEKGLAVGSHGRIVYVEQSINNSWSAQLVGTGTPHDLYDIETTYNNMSLQNNDNVAFAVGDNGTILKFNLGEPESFDMVCPANDVTGPFPSFSWNSISWADAYEIIVLLGNVNNAAQRFLTILPDTNIDFLEHDFRFLHNHEYLVQVRGLIDDPDEGLIYPEFGYFDQCAFTTQDSILHVNSNVAEGGANNGTSWQDAFEHLKDALEVLVSGQQVWVSGTHNPSPDFNGARGLSLLIENVSDVQVLGGFAGDENEAFQRDFTVNETILTGHIGNDNHSFRVLVVKDTDDTVLIDGFTVTGGVANSPDIETSRRGAGIYIDGSSVRLSNINVTGNEALGDGGGIYVTGTSAPRLDKISVSENSGNNGGGIAIAEGNVTINQSIIYQNDGFGGGIYIGSGGYVTVVNSIIYNNSMHGIAGSAQSGGTLSVINSTIYNNSVVGIYNLATDVWVDNSIFYGATQQSVDIILGTADGSFSITNSMSRAPLPDNIVDGGNNLVGNPHFVDPANVVMNNGLRLQQNSPAVNSGANGKLPDGFNHDFAGNDRIFDQLNGGIVDMGAYELQDDVQLDDFIEGVVDASDGQGANRSVSFGFSSLAGDSYNPGLDQLAPPSPPPGVFDLRFLKGEPIQGFYKDFRPYSQQTTIWNIHFQLSEGTDELFLSWNMSDLTNTGNYILSYSQMFTVTIDMKEQTSATIPGNAANLKILHIPQEIIELDLNYTDGWNLISLPVNMPGTNPFLLFPSGEPGTLFGFNGAYTDETVMDPGSGYWLLLNENEDVFYDELVLSQLDLSLSEGWNLIGTIGLPVAVSDITDPFDIIVAGSIFRFQHGVGYFPATTLQPGRGYWMKTNEAGNIGLSGGSPGRPLASDPDFSGFHKVSVQNLDNQPIPFYLGGNTSELPGNLFVEFPPRPPEAAFDVRFSTHTWLVEGETAELIFQSPGGNLTLAYLAADGQLESMMQFTILRNNGNPSETLLLHNGESAEISGSGLSRIELVLNPTVSTPGAGNELPAEVSLTQNYPNPFNPTTTITYGLPESGQVTLDIYNVTGQRVATLVNAQQAAGYHSITFDASRLASGLYLYRLQAGSTSITKRMMLVK